MGKETTLRKSHAPSRIKRPFPALESHARNSKLHTQSLIPVPNLLPPNLSPSKPSLVVLPASDPARSVHHRRHEGRPNLTILPYRVGEGDERLLAHDIDIAEVGEASHQCREKAVSLVQRAVKPGGVDVYRQRLDVRKDRGDPEDHSLQEGAVISDEGAVFRHLLQQFFALGVCILHTCSLRATGHAERASSPHPDA